VYSDTEDMIQALMRYGVSAMGIQSFWDYLAVEDGKQWCSDTFYSEEVK